MEIAIYVTGALCLIATIIAGLFGSLGHRDLLIWTSFVAVCLGFLTGFCWLQNYHWNKDAATKTVSNKHPERPYVILTSAVCDLDRMKDSDEARVINMAFSNASSTPAFDAGVISAAFLVERELQNGSAAPEVVPPPGQLPSKQFMAANTIMTQTLYIGSVITADRIEQIKRRDLFLYVHGRVTYEDRNANPTIKHTSNFCGQYEPKTRKFETAPFNNEVD